MNKRIILATILFLPMGINAGDYPTEAIVRNVIDCMSELGGITDPNLYTCICRADYMMEHMKFAEYNDAGVFDHNKGLVGDKAGVVRDNEEAKAASKKYETTLSEGEKNCPVVKHLDAATIKKTDKSE